MNYQFRRKPIVVEAFQMTETRRWDNSDWPDWLNIAWQKEHHVIGAVYPSRLENRSNYHLTINTLEETILVSWGDWIIRGVYGELYACKPDIFEAIYEPVLNENL